MASRQRERGTLFRGHEQSSLHPPSPTLPKGWTTDSPCDSDPVVAFPVLHPGGVRRRASAGLSEFMMAVVPFPSVGLPFDLFLLPDVSLY